MIFWKLCFESLNFSEIWFWFFILWIYWKFMVFWINFRFSELVIKSRRYHQYKKNQFAIKVFISLNFITKSVIGYLIFMYYFYGFQQCLSYHWYEFRVNEYIVVIPIKISLSFGSILIGSPACLSVSVWIGTNNKYRLMMSKVLEH